ncbi:hypothetical protein EZS27_012030 [termite gut metagenome]|uniref:Uncharacterized protein n=1 Tax=termite gut metagenome TaxID=433724 RepID=A0A5J4S1N5_9ZZZZ
MEKKFMKYLLFGVFTFVLGIAFVGCGEDYDDDISSLKNEDVALKSALEKAVSDLQGQITALANAPGGGNYDAIIATINGQIQTLKDAVKKLEDAGGTGGGGDLNYDAIAAELVNHEDFVAAIIAEISKSNPDLVTLEANINGLITGIHVLSGQILDYDLTLGKRDWVFGSVSPYTFKNGEVRPEGSVKEVILQVTPAYAPLSSADLISLVNSKGESAILDYLDVKLERYNDLLTRAFDVTPQVGLYKVTFTVKPETYKTPENIKAFNSLVKANNRPVEFAIAVKGKLGSEADERYVLSPFEVTLDGKEYPSIYSHNASDTGLNNQILFNVTDKEYNPSNPITPTTAHNLLIDNIRNRYFQDNYQSSEYVWDSKTGGADPTKSTKRAANNLKEKRSTQALLPILLNQPFTVNSVRLIDVAAAQPVTSLVHPTANSYTYAEPIALAYYVGLDTDNTANSSGENAADVALWKAEGAIDGLYQAYPISQNASITVKAANLKGKEIGFRVYVVNHDGTLVDPDGRAFYALVDAPPAEGGVLKFEPDIISYVENPTHGKVPVDGTVPTNEVTITYPSGVTSRDVSTAEFSLTSNSNKSIFGAAAAADISGAYTFIAATNVSPAKLKFTGTVPSKMKEDVTYEGKLVLKNGIGLSVAQYKVELTKTLPVSGPQGGERIAMNDTIITSGANSTASTPFQTLHTTEWTWKNHAMKGSNAITSSTATLYDWHAYNYNLGVVYDINSDGNREIKIIPAIERNVYGGSMKGLSYEFTNNVMKGLFATAEVVGGSGKYYFKNDANAPTDINIDNASFIITGPGNVDFIKQDGNKLSIDGAYTAFTAQYDAYLAYNYGQVLYKEKPTDVVPDYKAPWRNKPYKLQIVSPFQAYNLALNTAALIPTTKEYPVIKKDEKKAYLPLLRLDHRNVDYYNTAGHLLTDSRDIVIRTLSQLGNYVSGDIKIKIELKANGAHADADPVIATLTNVAITDIFGNLGVDFDNSATLTTVNRIEIELYDTAVVQVLTLAASSDPLYAFITIEAKGVGGIEIPKITIGNLPIAVVQ